MIRAKREQESKRLIKSFDEEPDLQVLNGRYGAYICYKKENYKLPKSVSDPSALTVEMCMEIVKAGQDKESGKKKTTRKKAASK